MAEGYTSYPFNGFGGGLNLRDKADSVDPAECVDAMNVLFSDRGAIEQRPGYDNFTSVALTNRVDSLEPFYTSAGTKQLLAGCGTRLEGIKADGTVIDSETGLTSAAWDFARFGKPNEEAAYAGNGTDTLRKWNGTEWTAPKATVDGAGEKAMPKARFLCVQLPDNRLVATGFSTTTGGPNGKTSSPSHVFFSNEGDPEKWETEGSEEHPDNSVQLSPGDGEAIQGAITWREFLFVFKETKFFVFYGNSTEATGAPVFNVRAVETGVGLASPRTLCADHTGVYFMSRGGVYRTTGQEPELISSAVEPIWSGDISPFYTGGTLAHGSITNCAMTVHGERLYLSFPTESANNRTLVYDPQFEWWSLLDIPCSALASFRISSAPELVFGYASGSNHIGRHGASYTNDDGTAITSRWRSGWFDLESPDVKTIRSSKLWGSGEVFCGMGHDFEQSTGTLDLLNMASASATEWDKSEWGAGEWARTPGLVASTKRRATRGTVFSLYLYNGTKDTEWTLHRATHHVREIRKPSTVSA